MTDNRDLSNVRYDDRLVKMSTGDPNKLPGLKRSVDTLGPIREEIACAWGLKRDVMVVMGTPDIQSAAIGSGAVRDFEGHLISGHHPG